MATEVNSAKLLKAVKSGKNHAQAADELGLTPGQLPMLTFNKAQVEAKQYSTIPATAASVKKARDSEGNRWELIAARTGVSVAKVKELYPGDPNKSYTGRGRNFSGAKRAAPAKKAGNTSRTTRGGKQAPKPAGKARTRAERQAKAGNPS